VDYDKSFVPITNGHILENVWKKLYKLRSRIVSNNRKSFQLQWNQHSSKLEGASFQEDIMGLRLLDKMLRDKRCLGAEGISYMIEGSTIAKGFTSMIEG